MHHSSRSCLPPFYTIPIFPLLNQFIYLSPFFFAAHCIAIFNSVCAQKSLLLRPDMQKSTPFAPRKLLRPRTYRLRLLKRLVFHTGPLGYRAVVQPDHRRHGLLFNWTARIRGGCSTGPPPAWPVVQPERSSSTSRTSGLPVDQPAGLSILAEPR